MRFLSLFAGIGGFDLGLERAGMTCVGQVENDPYCLKVLEKHWPDVPRWGDIRDVTEETLADAFSIWGHGGNGGSMGNSPSKEESGKPKFGRPPSFIRNSGEGRNKHKDKTAVPTVDLICGGYPCQPFSHAGKRQGEEDDRHLWPEMYRLLVALRPTWFLAENVAGHITMGLDQVLSDLEAEGYTSQTIIVPACAVDAPHRRDRCWVVADANRSGQPTDQGSVRTQRGNDLGRRSQDVADAKGVPKRPRLRKDGTKPSQWVKPSNSGGDGWRWLPEPDVGRVAHGVPSRVDRLKCLGNAVVPQIPEIIGRAILTAEGK
jgi:DNA (cytosine-5)-methyltransferase 1